MRMLISRFSMAATPMLIVCGLLASGASAMAESNDGPCSNRTLSGDYGFSLKGELLVAPGVSLPLRGVVMVHYDGKGNLTQVDYLVVNGTPLSQGFRPGTGTYSVNKDCTGTSVINIPGSAPVAVHMVVVRQGQQIDQVVDANAVTSVGIKVE